jgi:hypothetical protein
MSHKNCPINIMERYRNALEISFDSLLGLFKRNARLCIFSLTFCSSF